MFVGVIGDDFDVAHSKEKLQAWRCPATLHVE